MASVTVPFQADEGSHSKKSMQKHIVYVTNYWTNHAHTYILLYYTSFGRDHIRAFVTVERPQRSLHLFFKDDQNRVHRCRLHPQVLVTVQHPQAPKDLYIFLSKDNHVCGFTVTAADFSTSIVVSSLIIGSSTFCLPNN